MNPAMDHERCSELLRGYVEGRLSSGEARAVESHLAACVDCRSEEVALRSLLAPLEPLTEAESQTIRAAVGRALREDGTAADVVPLDPRGRGAWRWGRVLAAAALLLVAVIAARSLPFPGGSDGEAVSGGAGEDQAVAEVRDHLSFRRPPGGVSGGGTTTLEAATEPDAVADEDRPEDPHEFGNAPAGRGGDGERSATKQRSAVPPRPLFVRDAGRLNDRRLTLVGRYGLPLVLFPQAYTVADASDLEETFLGMLANAAGSEADRGQVLECGAQVLSRPDPVLPALATFGTSAGERVFALAFGWSEATEGPLDRFMVWTWPAGDCSAAPGYRSGPIGP